MDLIIELKIKNPSDWAMLQPLLERLKIRFTKKENQPPQVVNPQNLADRFAGKLDAANAASFHQQLNESRQEWERTF